VQVQSQGITLAAILSAVYVSFALLSSYVWGTVTHGAENFIVRSLVFVILTAFITGFGYSTMMGGISGLVLEFTVPTPVRFYLLPSLIAYGFVFDLVSNLGREETTPLGTVRILVGTIFASFAMSAVALSVFTIVGFFPTNLLPLIWSLEIATDISLGIIGALIGLALIRQLKQLRP
jgi:hypothetical protein